MDVQSTGAVSQQVEYHLDRPLSSLEKIFWRLSEAAPLNFTMISRVRGPLSTERLHEALKFVQYRYPLLRVRIQNTDTGPVFRTGGVLPIPLHTVDASLADWVSIVEREINSPISCHVGPLARCVHVRHGEDLQHLLLTLHHSIGDGISGALLVRDLVHEIGWPDSDRPPKMACKFPDIRPMNERLPDRAVGVRGLLNRLRLYLKFGLQDALLNKPASIRADREAAPHERHIRVVAREFDGSFTRQVVQRARQESTTVHGALSAAMCLETARDIAGDEHVSIKHRSPVNMRKHLVPPVGEELGMFASMVFFRDKVSSRDDFWSLSREISAQLTAGVDAGVPEMVVKMLPELYWLVGGDRLSDEELAERWRKVTPTTTGLTNIGRLNMETHAGELEIESLHFAVAPSALADFSCTAASIAGRLNWNFMCPEPVFSYPRATQLADRIVERLQRAVQ